PVDGGDMDPDKRIRRLEKEEGIALDELQRKAVRLAADRTLLLLSGGPGTGKTTTINTIIHYFEAENMDVLLAAPTGRAARRMAEATGREAMTIHRLLGVRGGPDKKEDRQEDPAGTFSDFEKDRDNPLEADAVIIDEMSMVDMYLMHALLSAILPGTRLIMVGDVNQLPSVGPGNVLRDLIASAAFPTVMLEKIFRQAAESDIVMNAHRILRGEMPRLDNRSRDFFFLERSDPQVIYKHMVELMTSMLPGYVGCRTEEIQVLTPMRKGALGVEKLNEVLQGVLNPPRRGRGEYTFRDTVYRVGDKVMQTRNNYQIEWKITGNYDIPLEQGTGIFNGDCGRILEIREPAETMIVCFDDERIVEYPFSDLEDLDLAYAVTVHKSQGTEYPAVIMPLLSGPSSLFTRNLLYTAVTRARRCAVLLGSRDTVRAMTANVRQGSRNTGLEDRVHEITGSYGDEKGSVPESLLSKEMPGL
ncbi:MAG: AAA family ATPase, partial [Lachnospiraceae bacterium]|nr:AAA family ATPase [Lachnospiraceae bacterium]